MNFFLLKKTKEERNYQCSITNYSGQHFFGTFSGLQFSGEPAVSNFQEALLRFFSRLMTVFFIKIPIAIS